MATSFSLSTSWACFFLFPPLPTFLRFATLQVEKRGRLDSNAHMENGIHFSVFSHLERPSGDINIHITNHIAPTSEFFNSWIFFQISNIVGSGFKSFVRSYIFDFFQAGFLSLNTFRPFECRGEVEVLIQKLPPQAVASETKSNTAQVYYLWPPLRLTMAFCQVSVCDSQSLKMEESPLLPVGGGVPHPSWSILYRLPRWVCGIYPDTGGGWRGGASWSWEVVFRCFLMVFSQLGSFSMLIQQNPATY